jgi:HPt (histidine-containing phosphotransfer) domain-containing protein
MSKLNRIPEEVLPLIPGYLERKRMDVSNLNRYLEERRFDECKALGHRLKGSGASYGFSDISELGRQIELAAEKHDVSELTECALTFENQIEDIIEDFRHQYARWTPPKSKTG